METITITLTKNELERIQFAVANSSFERKSDYYKEILKNNPDTEKLQALQEIQAEYVELFNKLRNLNK